MQIEVQLSKILDCLIHKGKGINQSLMNMARLKIRLTRAHSMLNIDIFSLIFLSMKNALHYFMMIIFMELTKCIYFVSWKNKKKTFVGAPFPRTIPIYSTVTPRHPFIDEIDRFLVHFLVLYGQTIYFSVGFYLFVIHLICIKYCFSFMMMEKPWSLIIILQFSD